MFLRIVVLPSLLVLCLTACGGGSSQSSRRVSGAFSPAFAASASANSSVSVSLVTQDLVQHPLCSVPLAADGTFECDLAEDSLAPNPVDPQYVRVAYADGNYLFLALVTVDELLADDVVVNVRSSLVAFRAEAMMKQGVWLPSAVDGARVQMGTAFGLAVGIRTPSGDAVVNNSVSAAAAAAGFTVADALTDMQTDATDGVFGGSGKLAPSFYAQKLSAALATACGQNSGACISDAAPFVTAPVLAVPLPFIVLSPTFTLLTPTIQWTNPLAGVDIALANTCADAPFYQASADANTQSLGLAGQLVTNQDYCLTLTPSSPNTTGLPPIRTTFTYLGP